MNINTALGIEVTDEKLEELSQKWQQIKEEMKGINPEDMKPVLRAMGLCYDKEVEAFGDALIISTFAEVCFGLDAGQFLPENRIKLFNILNKSPESFARFVRKSPERLWYFSSNKTCRLYLCSKGSRDGSVIFPVAMLLEHFRPLGSITLSGIHIGDAEVNTLSDALKVNSSLTELNLQGNGIGDAGATSLSDALKINSSLAELNLHANEIGASGATSLSESLQINSSVTELDLSRNYIGDSGAASLSNALEVNSSLTELDLQYNSIGDSGVASISNALNVNSSLTELNLSYNRIGDSGKKSLGDALEENVTITAVDLWFQH